MSNEIIPPPTSSVPPTGAAILTHVGRHHPTTAQVVGATIQNCFVIGAVTSAWLLDKLPTEFALPALLLVVGVNLPITISKKAGPAIVMGATGVVSLLGQFPFLAAVLAVFKIGR